jgi:hypothetical protein
VWVAAATATSHSDTVIVPVLPFPKASAVVEPVPLLDDHTGATWSNEGRYGNDAQLRRRRQRRQGGVLPGRSG